MLFQRTKPLALWRKILNFIYPQIGFRRAMTYIYLRILRLKGNPRRIARGLAFGVAVSMTPFIGFHLTIIALLCLMFRGNVIAGFLSSLLGNPFTFPFIWYVIYLVGVVIVPSPGVVDLSPLALFDMFENFVTAVWTWDQDLFFNQVWSVWFPMLIGCIPLFLIAYFVTYGFAIKTIEKFRGLRK